MCGIAGFIARADGDALSPEQLRRMADVMHHRGPDDEGFYQKGRANLAFRRLSIVDLAGGHQPMSNEDDSLWVIFNGEIYNHAEHRAHLDSLGHRYKTNADTEFILHSYEEYSQECLHKFRGMFAFCIWNAKTNEAFFARDRFGIKPLYYAALPQGLLFGSEIKCLFASGLIQPELNESVLAEFLTFGYLSGEDTLFKGVKRLMPGHWMTYKGGALSKERYWRLDYSPMPNPGSDEELTQQFRDLFKKSVKYRLMSDVPLGVFLSGGIDSSAIAIAMAELINRPIETFSVGFAEHGFSEFQFSRQVAERISANRHEVVISSDKFFETLPKLIWHEDEPIRWPSSVPLFHLAQYSKQFVTVALTGEGSDEMLAGYPRIWATLKNAKVASVLHKLTPRRLRTQFFRPNVWKMPMPMRAKKLFYHSPLAWDSSPSSLFVENFHAIFDSTDLARLYPQARSDSFRRQAYANFERHYEECNADGMLQQMLHAETRTFLHELLMKQDQMSMAASIESRVPFLDHEFARFCASLPPRMLVRGTETKYILRRAFAKELPPVILARGKMGFPVPIMKWVKENLRNEVFELLCSTDSRCHAVCDKQEIRRILEAHYSNRRDCSEKVWLLLNLELWWRESLKNTTAYIAPSAQPLRA